MRYGKTTDEELALILEEGEGYTLKTQQPYAEIPPDPKRKNICYKITRL